MNEPSTINHPPQESRATRAELEARVVENFRKADARYAAYIGLDLMPPREALGTLAMVRETWEALFPGIGERLVAERAEQAALRRQGGEEAAA